MEPEGSIPCSQEPSTGPYPEPYPYNIRELSNDVKNFKLATKNFLLKE
jgi:hypothetical protein